MPIDSEKVKKMKELRIPKNLKKVIRDINKKDKWAIAAGVPLIKHLMENKPDVWLVYTDADVNLMKLLFPEGKMDSTEYDFFIAEEHLKNGKKNPPIGFELVSESFEDFQKKNKFTTEAIYFNGEELIDPYEGLNDINMNKFKLLETTRKKLTNDPQVALDIIMYAAKTGLDIAGDLKEYLSNKVKAVQSIEKKNMAEWFQELIVSECAGEGLKLLKESRLLPAVVGDSVWRTMNKNEKKGYDLFCKNISKALPILETRLTVFYLGFLKNRDMKAMSYLDFDERLIEREKYAHEHLPELHFVRKKKQLKRLIYDEGFENYRFLENVAKVQCKVYEIDTTGIFERHSMLLDISANNEPVFVEDLALKKADLLKSGIVKTEKRADEILAILPYYVQKWPRFNTKEILLDQSKRIQRNKWKEYKLKHRFFRG